MYSRRELAEGTQEITTALGPEAREKVPGPLRANWPFMPLKKWFAERSEASITLTFQEIERILGRKLSPSVRKYTSRWYTRPDRNVMAEAWVTEGYKLFKVDLEREKATFHRARDGVSHIKIPEWLTAERIPDPYEAYDLPNYFPRLFQKSVINSPEPRQFNISNWNSNLPKLREAKEGGPPPRPQNKIEMGGM